MLNYPLSPLDYTAAPDAMKAGINAEVDRALEVERERITEAMEALK